jgi:5-methylcytosine-specific restriction endonuclease McrA
LFQAVNRPHEIESRWQLVEAAWDLSVARNLITVNHDHDKGLLFTQDRQLRRVDLTSSRSALNGYQKGKCFYCFRNIAVGEGAGVPAEVDHFFPHVLKQHGVKANVNGVWNLVLACQGCNRGVGGKSARVPATRLLARLNRRNDFLIASHHPLRETLLKQTGLTREKRRLFLQSVDHWASERLIHRWEPDDGDELEPEF